MSSKEKECPDCEGAGKIQLFTSWEDPCTTCDGVGRVTIDESETSSVLGWESRKRFLRAYAKDMYCGSVKINSFPCSKKLTIEMLGRGFTDLKDQGLSTEYLMVDAKTFEELCRFPNTSTEHHELGDRLLWDRDAQILPDKTFPDHCIMFVPWKFDASVRLSAVLWNDPEDGYIVWSGIGR